MQVSVEKPGGLERRMRVSIPAEEFDQAVDANLRRIGQNARLDGFRPGKVPFKVLRQRYGARARQEALSELLESSYPRALQESELQPAGQPQIEFESLEGGQDLAYVATFDVYPEIEVQGIDGMAIKDPECEITDADVDTVLMRLREQRREYQEKDAPAAEGDRVTIDFKGTIDGEPFAGGEGEDTQVELGAERFLKSLEDGIVGMRAGESRDVPVTFPEDYHAEELKGKQASFAVTLKQVEVSQLPEIDEEFLQQFGVEEGGEEALKVKLRESLETERGQAEQRYRKKQVMENLLAANAIDVPKGLVDQEIERMRHEAAQRFGQSDKNHDELHRMLPDELFTEQAERRTRLGLLVGELIKAKQISVDDAQVEARLKEIAGDTADNAAALQYYRSNPQFMQSLRAMVLEEQVVHYCLQQAKRESERLTFDELTQKAAD